MMNNINPFLCSDGYKVGHYWQYPQGTTMVYSNFTPRHGGYSNVKDSKGVMSFGQQMVMKQIKEMFDKNFFGNQRNVVCQEIKKEYSMYLGADYDVSHIEALWDLGYLPIKMKSLPEGTFAPYGVPVLTIVNTKPEFFWLTNFLETLISNMLWMPMTAATTAYAYKKGLTEACLQTDADAIDFVDFQGHNFGMRGMAGMDATVYSGIGHATSFKGDDSLPTIFAARKYYNEKEFVVGSVNATEHSVMCAGGDQDELETFRYLMKQFPTGILSIVSDTWDLWKVITEYLPTLKEEILARDGKIVIRPDSGDPVDIICGEANKYEDISKYFPEGDILPKYFEDYLLEEVREDTPHGECGVSEHTGFYKIRGDYYKVTINSIDWNRHDKQYYFIEMYGDADITVEEVVLNSKDKGVIELLWDLFGGTVNKQGYKVLDPHIGAIYGDSITLERANQICKRLEAKGFASTNIVLGIGSFTYQYVTRDTHGFAMKATYCEVFEEGKGVSRREIFKDPVTDDGVKKSAKGLLMVQQNDISGDLELVDQVSWEQESEGELQVIFEDGKFSNQTTLTEIRDRIKKVNINIIPYLSN